MVLWQKGHCMVLCPYGGVMEAPQAGQFRI
jgi:hypothetical protein